MESSIEQGLSHLSMMLEQAPAPGAREGGAAPLPADGAGAAPPAPAAAIPGEAPAALAAKRRGPGRPSKLPPPPQVPVHGIVSAPTYEDSLLELGFDSPDAFKQLFLFLGKLGCPQVILHATPTQLSFNALSSTEQLSASAVVEGSRMNHYYCARDLWLNLCYDDVKDIFKRVDKTFNLITFNYRTMDAIILEINLKNFVLHRTNKFCVNVREVPPMSDWDSVIDLYTHRDESHITWVLPIKAFKKTHDIAATSSDYIDITHHHGASNLVLQWRGTGYAPCREEYADPAVIHFRSSLAPGEALQVRYSSACGKALSGIAPTDTVQVYCTNSKPILLVFDGPGIAIAVEMLPTAQDALGPA